MKGRIVSMGYGLDGDLLVTLSLPRSGMEELKGLKNEDIDATFKKWRRKRSRDSNSLMWAICQELSDALKIPKEEVYRKAIKDIGEFIALPIREDAVETFQRNWASKGIGWYSEIVDDSKLKGYKLVFAYYGSSTYDTKRMSLLLDYLVDEAQQIGIVLRASNRELEEAKRRWGDG